MLTLFQEEIDNEVSYGDKTGLNTTATTTATGATAR